MVRDELSHVLRGKGAALLSRELGGSAPDEAPGLGSAGPAFELVQNGLTFDLYIVPQPVHRGGAASMPLVPDLPPPERRRTVLALIAGPHLATERAVLPVVRGQWQLVERLCELLDRVDTVSWEPSEVELPAGVFRSLARAWRTGGVFPPQGLIAFARAMGGGLHSSGLAYFTGQELRIEPDACRDLDHATRLGLRLSETLMHRGPLTETEQLADPRGGAIRLEPSANGKFVRVWPA